MDKELQFRKLLKFAWENSPFYREIYSKEGIKEGDLNTIELQDLPTVSKEDLMLRFDEVVTDPRLKLEEIKEWSWKHLSSLYLYLDNYLIVASSGGSNIDSYIPYPLEVWRKITTLVVKDLFPEVTTLQKPQRSAFYFGGGGGISASGTNVLLASRLTHEVLRLALQDPIEEVWARLNGFQPERLTGYGSAIAWLTDWAAEGKIDIKPKIVVATADFLPERSRDLIENLWGSEIYDLYAAAESVFIGLKKPGKDFYSLFQDINIIEVLDKRNRMVEEGMRGQVYLTNLVNKTLPMIRYDLMDYATLGDSTFGATELISLDGKIFDGLKIPTTNGGTKEIPVYELNKIDIPGLNRIQFITHDPKSIEIKYKSDKNITSKIEEYFRRMVGDNLSAIRDFKITRVDHINNGRGAKFFNVINPEDRVIEFNSFEGHNGNNFRNEVLEVHKHKTLIFTKEYKSIIDRFEQVCNLFDRKIALVDSKETYTYKELDNISNIIAGDIKKLDFNKNKPVVILSGQNVNAILMIFGVIKAGGFFTYINTESTESHIERILSEVEPELIVTEKDYRNLASKVNRFTAKIISLRDFYSLVENNHIDINISINDPACLVFTSGTTGKPNGIVYSHSTILSRVERITTDFNINNDDNISLLPSLGVNAGLRDIFSALLNGATLNIFDIVNQGTHRVPQWIEKQKITHLYVIPTVWKVINEVDKNYDFSNLRIIRLGGEPVSVEDYQYFKEKEINGCLLVNGYAATEIGTMCQYIMDQSTQFVADRMSVGQPVDGINIQIVGKDGNSLQNSIGEIVVEGETIAYGVWDSIKKKVVPFDQEFYSTGDIGYRINDGRYFILGRKDRSVSVHGYLINLENLEKSLLSQEDVSDVAAVYDSNNQEIIVYYALNENARITKSDVDFILQTSLPARKIKIREIVVTRIPRTPSSKVDNYELVQSYHLDSKKNKIIDINPAEYLDEGDEIQVALAKLWKEVLSIDEIYLEDDFFEKGGDSISAFRLINNISSKFGVDISVMELFDNLKFINLVNLVKLKLI